MVTILRLVAVKEELFCKQRQGASLRPFIRYYYLTYDMSMARSIPVRLPILPVAQSMCYSNHSLY